MKYKILIFSILAIFANFSYAQQQPLYSHFVNNNFLLNPAVSGTDETAPLQMTVRQQWTGIEDAPSTQALSGHFTLEKLENCGVGGVVYRDKFGPISQTGLHAAFSYHIRVAQEARLSFGTSASFFQYTIDETNLNIINPDDPFITRKKETNWVPDANFGVLLYHPKYFVGISSTQLIQNQVFDYPASTGQVVRHYYMNAGYRFNTGKQFVYMPSVMIKTSFYTPVQMDLNMQVHYAGSIMAGASYRHKDAVVIMGGWRKNRVRVAYAFDLTISPLAAHNYGSHELMLSYELRKVITEKPLF